jgi:hypothetical protein
MNINPNIDILEQVSGKSQAEVIQWAIDLQATEDRRFKLLERSLDYLDDWLYWLETNTAKDNDDLNELVIKIGEEIKSNA